MGISNKQKRAMRVRQKMASRQPSKIRQIQNLMQTADNYEKSIYIRAAKHNRESR